MSSAIGYWKSRVEAHHQQSIRRQEAAAWTEADRWEGLTSQFKADPHRTGDPILDRLVQDVGANTTVLDVGGGAGRLALPLALRCRHVTVVESSPSMVDALKEGVEEAGIENLSIVQSLWEEATTDPADVVLCVHVVSGIAEIEAFIRKLESHTRERVMVIESMEHPMARVSPFWEPVHRETRMDLPALPELLRVLWEMEIYPDLEMFEETDPEGAPSPEAALFMLRQYLYVKPDTEEDQRLRETIRDLAVETPEGLTVRGARPRRRGLLSWKPS